MVNLITLATADVDLALFPPVFLCLDAACQFFPRNIRPIHLSGTRQGMHVYHSKAEKTLAALSASSSR